MTSSPEGRQEAAVLDAKDGWERRAKWAEKFLATYADGDKQKLLGGYDFHAAVRHLAGAVQQLTDQTGAALIPAKPAVEVVEALLIRWAHDTLYEIGSPSDFRSQSEVKKLNDASVEVILGLAQYLGERHGKTEEWWCDYRARHPLAALQAPATPNAQTFPPTSCNAWEDCNHDGLCHDPRGCGGIGPNSSDAQTEVEK